MGWDADDFGGYDPWDRPMPCAGYALPSRNWGWITAAGTYITIKDATTRHLENTARLLERRGDWKTNDLYFPILAEIQRRKNQFEKEVEL